MITRDSRNPAPLDVHSSYSLLRRALSGLALVAVLLAAIRAPLARGQDGTWTQLNHLAPADIWYTMILLPDGSVMCQQIAAPAVANWYRLTPDRTGSYVNGTWSALASSNETRNTNGSQVLRDGRVLVIGAEYGTGDKNAEVYNPLTNVWTRVIDNSGGVQEFLDSCTEMLPDGRVLIAPAIPAVLGGTLIYDPATNAMTAGPVTVNANPQDESGWVKLPDNSILTIDSASTTAERFIPTLNQWVADAETPATLWSYGELGPGMLLANGKVFFVGGNGNTALYTPSGDDTPGTWVAGPVVPDGNGEPDGGAVMLVNGRELFAAAPIPTHQGDYPRGVSFYEYDPVANAIAKVSSPAIVDPYRPLVNGASYEMGFLALPDGSVLFTNTTSDLWIYHPNGTPLAAAKPTISSITQNSDGSYHLVGTLLNGISEGAMYGDDAQISTNRPLVRITDTFGTVSYARTYDWSSTGVATGSAPLSTEFAEPYNGTYSLVVIANGVASDPTTLVVTNSTDGPPTITAQPEAFSAQAGATATFIVTAIGTGTFAYQWQAQALGASTWTNVTDGNGVSGANTATLSIVPTAAQNGFSYRCLVQNSATATSNSAVLLVAAPLTLSTFSGAPGQSSPGTGTVAAARYSNPQGIAVDAAGNIYVANTGNHTISKINVAGNSVTTLAGTAGSAGIVDGDGAAARFNSPWGIGVDSAGNVFVADSAGETIRKITPNGTVTTLAGTAGVSGSADGMGTAATFDNPSGLSVDAAGNVFVCDQNNHTIRKITSAGVVTTFIGTAGQSGRSDGTGAAARLGSPTGIALDPSGDLIIVEGGNDSVRRITPAGVVTTIAGNFVRGYADGIGTSAEFTGPRGLAVSASGEIFVADTGNNVIRQVSPTGIVTTIAGAAGSSGSTNGTGASARLRDPFALAVSAAGVLYIADTSNLTIRASSSVLPPLVASQPDGQSAAAGGSVGLTVTADGSPLYQWRQNGDDVAGGTASTLTISSLQPKDAGIYDVALLNSYGTTTSDPAIVGVTTTSEIIGSGEVAPGGSNITHPNGNHYDQTVLTNASPAAASFTTQGGRVTRLSYIDLNNDIVQVEFSGAGTVSIVLDGASGPALPVNYNQNFQYVKGHAGIVVTGADATSNLLVFTVGRFTAFDPHSADGGFNILLPVSETNNPANNMSSLFVGHEATNYDGVADLAFVAISSPTHQFGGLRLSNTRLWATKGITGIYAPGVTFNGPVYVSDIDAMDDATPYLVIGSAAVRVGITGGSLLQGNGRAVHVAGVTALHFQDGLTSDYMLLPAQANAATLVNSNDQDVTSQIVLAPGL